MKRLLLKIFCVILNCIYCLFKLFPMQDKILFLSRQTNQEVLNFNLLKDELIKDKKIKKIVIRNKKIPKRIYGKICYAMDMLFQMYHIATSKVIILDSYNICVSVLKHKKKLKVIQLWHACGAFKKFGYSSLDTLEGSSSLVAKHMKMHNNYDYILASSEFTKEKYEEAFNSNNVIVMNTPYIDYLNNKKVIKDVINKINKEYSFTKKKKIILYAPTFRKCFGQEKYISNLFDNIDYSKYILIYKKHPLSEDKTTNDNVIYDKNFTALEWLMYVDFVITDYSALTIEACILNKKIYFYDFDYEEYNKDRGFYVNYKKLLKVYRFSNPNKVNKLLETDYNFEKITEFKDLMIEDTRNNTNKVVKLIQDILKKEGN